MYLKGEGIAQDISEAIKYSKLASDQGSKEAQYNLGCIYLQDNTISKNPVEALKYFKLAAHQGDAEALTYLDKHNPQDSLPIRCDLVKQKDPVAIAYFQHLLISIPKLDKQLIRQHSRNLKQSVRN